MSESVFGYPGGKTYLAPTIVDLIPEHECYVEPFCGSASVLLNKPRSRIEVINDQDGDIVQFFEVLRDRPEDLVEWLRAVPYSREAHEKWSREFYDGDRVDDPVERAGRFFFLRYSQFAAKYRTKSGFSASSVRNVAQKFANGRENLLEFSRRFDGVTIEKGDYAEIVERFDKPSTFFYFDPPYLEVGDALYTHGTFDHGRFCEVLESIEGDWIVSYDEVPEPLADSLVLEAEFAQKMNNTRPDRNETRTERLLANFDPADRPAFSGPNQATLDFTQDAEVGSE